MLGLGSVQCSYLAADSLSSHGDDFFLDDEYSSHSEDSVSDQVSDMFSTRTMRAFSEHPTKVARPIGSLPKGVALKLLLKSGVQMSSNLT